MKTRRFAAGVIAGLTALSFGLAGCSTDDPATDPSAGKTYTIASAVIVAHPSLQLIQDGFEDVLNEEGVKYTMISQNAQGEPANATTIANVFADNSDIDLILAISTPIALAMANIEQDRPILFAGITDPVSVGLVPSWDKTGANITGTSDLNPEAYPVKLVTEVLPNATTIGVLYSSSEPNSIIQVEQYRTEAAALGVTIKAQAITAASEITVGLEALGDVDAVLIPTDNTIIAALATVVAFGQEHQLPIFSADADSVSVGTIATRGLSYYDLGRRTGEMAVAILRDGKPLAEILPLAVTQTTLIVNPGAAAKFGVTIPDSVLEGATVVETES